MTAAAPSRDAPPVLPSVREAFVSVRLGAAEFGLPMSQVLEVLRPPPVTPVPFSPPAVCGVASVRGTVIPVVDLGLRLVGAPAARPGRLVVVAGPAGGPVGLLADDVMRIVEAPSGGAEAAPDAGQRSLPEGFITGVVTSDGGRTVALLDLHPVLSLRADARPAEPSPSPASGPAPGEDTDSEEQTE